MISSSSSSPDSRRAGSLVADGLTCNDQRVHGLRVRLSWVAYSFVLLAIAGLVLGLPTGPSSEARSASRSADPGFPRTYHLWGADHPAKLARYDFVVGYAHWDVRALRRHNPSGIFLLTPGLRPRDPRDYKGLSITYGALHAWLGGVDRLPGGPRLGRIRPYDPQWDLLYNADGSVASVNNEWRHHGWNLADPLRKGTPDLIAQVIAHASKRGGVYADGWDGIHLDNWIYRIGVSWFYGASLDTDRDGRIDDYETLRRNWARGLTRAGLLLRRYLPGKIVGGNGNWNVAGGSGLIDFRSYLQRPDDHLRSASYTLIEGLELYTRRADEIVERATEWLDYRDSWGAERYLAMLQRLPSASDYRAARWGMSLATISGAYYGAWVDSHGDFLWFDELDGGLGIRSRHWLGHPLGSPVKHSTGVWRRDFENGIVLNNSTPRPVMVDLGGTFVGLRGTQDATVNEGSIVTSVTLAPFDGLFLRRTAFS